MMPVLTFARFAYREGGLREERGHIAAAGEPRHAQALRGGLHDALHRGEQLRFCARLRRLCKRCLSNSLDAVLDRLLLDHEDMSWKEGTRLHGQVLACETQEGARLRCCARGLHPENRRHLLFARILHPHNA